MSLTFESSIDGIFLVLSAVVAIIDVRRFVIHDAIVLPALVGTIAARYLWDREAAAGYVVAAVAAIAVLAIVWYLTNGQLGLGDVKLAGYIGSVLGVRLLVPFAFWVGVLGLLIALPLLIFRKVTLSQRIPFGPFLVGGAWIALLLEYGGAALMGGG